MPSLLIKLDVKILSVQILRRWNEAASGYFLATIGLEFFPPLQLHLLLLPYNVGQVFSVVLVPKMSLVQVLLEEAALAYAASDHLRTDELSDYGWL